MIVVDLTLHYGNMIFIKDDKTFKMICYVFRCFTKSKLEFRIFHIPNSIIFCAANTFVKFICAG